MSVLTVVRGVDAPDSAVSAGEIRNVVWDYLHGHSEPTPVRDVEVPFFDPENLSLDLEHSVEEDLQKRMSDVTWDARNQARSTFGNEGRFGHPILPIQCLEDAVSRNPETATSVAVRLRDGDRLEVIAPCGLHDLLNMAVRHNPRQSKSRLFPPALVRQAHPANLPKGDRRPRLTPNLSAGGPIIGRKGDAARRGEIEKKANIIPRGSGRSLSGMPQCRAAQLGVANQINRLDAPPPEQDG